MSQNGHESTIRELYYRQITATLLSDLLHFLYEALRCSAKGKITVSFALLRKPLKENLFYLEWLLADPLSMIQAFESEQPSDKTIGSVSEVRKREIVRRAVEKTNSGHWFDADLIYDFRYNKQFSLGFENLFQKANHLVTSFRFLETEPANFNFVFSDESARYSQWNGLYSYLPIILLHTVEIVEGLLSTFAKREEGIDLTHIHNLIGFAHWLDSGPHSSQAAGALAVIKSSLLEVGLSCPSCQTEIFSSDESLTTLYNENAISCMACSWKFDLNVDSAQHAEQKNED
ncbi:hypothetical protein [Luteimonas terrae]|uniref:Uncharacterized protein n=1 Tax=Luteimonas terrae TaxID=1530191 RepID=A0ABU1XT43_9GAMM|nr:hypothetical protein [Luteimonas terrae]MDR7191925.1 hypothetical protein [Luteimonas terrae]